MFYRKRSQALQRFQDRHDAGRQLGEKLAGMDIKGEILVLGLPRGGVPVAFEVASLLKARLDVFLVRKLGLPGREEVAMGAIASGGGIVLNENFIHRLGISQDAIDAVVHREKAELERREALYRKDRPSPEITGKTVLLVDDGLATGASMLVAVQSVNASQPFASIVAVPVGSDETCRSFQNQADQVVCLQTPLDFQAVGQWYRHFEQTSDQDVVRLLQRADQKNT